MLILGEPPTAGECQASHSLRTLAVRAYALERPTGCHARSHNTSTAMNEQQREEEAGTQQRLRRRSEQEEGGAKDDQSLVFSCHFLANEE